MNINLGIVNQIRGRCGCFKRTNVNHLIHRIIQLEQNQQLDIFYNNTTTQPQQEPRQTLNSILYPNQALISNHPLRPESHQLNNMLYPNLAMIQNQPQQTNQQQQIQHYHPTFPVSSAPPLESGAPPNIKKCKCRLGKDGYCFNCSCSERGGCNQLCPCFGSGKCNAKKK